MDSIDRYSIDRFTEDELVITSQVIRRMQACCSEWQQRNLPNGDYRDVADGMAEEAGEILHAIRCERSGIRGFGANSDGTKSGKLLSEVSDGVGDSAIYAINLCNFLGLDYWASLWFTFVHVMDRDWANNPVTGESIE